MPHVEVLVGSPSDLKFLRASRLVMDLQEVGCTVAVSACSAHRNDHELTLRIGNVIKETSVFVAAAGWSAALPGAVKAKLLGRSLATVFGVALPSEEYPDAADALMSIRRLPPGIDVICPDQIGTDGFNAIIPNVIEQAWAYDPANPDQEELKKVKAKIKQPQFNLELSQFDACLIEGKTKKVFDLGDGTVLVHSKDDITAGDGVKHDVLEGKAAASTRTTCNIFKLLENNGVRTHFVEQVDPVTFRARNVEMIPLELIALRYATGSYRDRFPDLPDGTRFEELVFEVFEKDDANHDPLLVFNFKNDLLHRYVPNTKAAESVADNLKAGDPFSTTYLSQGRYSFVTPELLDQLQTVTIKTFEVIERAWAEVGGVYIDFKIECGIDRETGELLVADVIDSDSGRLRFGEVDMSKQSYRDGTASLPEIKKKFDEVAALTDGFV